jgi:DNA-binding transcriptional MocR family regulator
MSRFAIIPASIYEDRRLDCHLRDTLSLLSTYADRNGWCWPNQETLASTLRLSRETINRHLRQLVELGYVESRRRQNGCLYRLLYDRHGDDAADPDVTPPSHQMLDGRHVGSDADITQNNTKNKTKEHTTEGRAHRLPVDWQPSSDDLTWAAREFPMVDLQRETRKFSNHWLAASGSNARKHSWGHAWRNWIDKAEKEYRNVRPLPPRDATSRGHRQTDEERRDRIADALRDLGHDDAPFGDEAPAQRRRD